MRSLTLHHFVVFGLLAWGLPAALFIGPLAIWLSLLTTAPILVSLWLVGRSPSAETPTPQPAAFLVVLCLGLVYLAVDATVGRMKFAENLFLSTHALSKTVEDINVSMSKGRGVVDLLGGIMIFLPFVLFDLVRRAPNRLRPALWALAGALAFYEVGISRGYLLMAIIVMLLGTKINVLRSLIAGGLSLLGFVAASSARGDFSNATFSNPLFDAIGVPFMNLTLLVGRAPDGAGWFDFLMEFFKKFIPSFFYSKSVFSFNAEMSKLIYPIQSDYLESISIFTYLGEYYYYKPQFLTALVGGCLLGLLCYWVEKLMRTHGFNSARYFAGFMCVVLLRSRVQDVFSFLLFLAIFIYLYRFIVAVTEDWFTTRLIERF